MSPYSEDKLDLLRPMVSHLQKLTEEAFEWTRSNFETWEMPPTLHTFDQLVRYYICRQLDKPQAVSVLFEREPLLSDGIEIRYLGHCIKMQKSDRNGLRSAATYAMMAWYNQNQLEMFAFEEVVDIRNVVLMWDFTNNFSLKDLRLILPNIGEPPITLSHPATLQGPGESDINNEARDIPELDEEDTRDEDETEEETGTEEP
jgi:hypothetical protein